jgi:hypothetical protein
MTDVPEAVLARTDDADGERPHVRGL